MWICARSTVQIVDFLNLYFLVLFFALHEMRAQINVFGWCSTPLAERHYQKLFFFPISNVFDAMRTACTTTFRMSIRMCVSWVFTAVCVQWISQFKCVAH